MKLFVAGVRKSGIVQQFWKKCWSKNMLGNPEPNSKKKNFATALICRSQILTSFSILPYVFICVVYFSLGPFALYFPDPEHFKL